MDLKRQTRPIGTVKRKRKYRENKRRAKALRRHSQRTKHIPTQQENDITIAANNTLPYCKSKLKLIDTITNRGKKT